MLHRRKSHGIGYTKQRHTQLIMLQVCETSSLLSFHGFHSTGGARGQYLGHHIFFLFLLDYLIDQHYIWDIGSLLIFLLSVTQRLT